tara:strand:+ start:91 stop:492 length:402 start_codon:yes stop_codon:yes gene_type:complete
MNIKTLSILFVLLLIVSVTKKENFADGYMNEASGGLLNKDKSSPFKKNKDPNSPDFNSGIDSLIKDKSENDRAIIVNEDTKDLDIDNEAIVEHEVRGEEGSGCSDVLLFGLVLLIVIYIVYFQINKLKELQMN